MSAAILETSPLAHLSVLAHELTLSAIDLTRACSNHEAYLTWCQEYAMDSAQIAQYFTAATVELEEQLKSGPGLKADPFAARETLADELMTAPPMSQAQLIAAAEHAIADAQLVLFARPVLIPTDAYFSVLAEVNELNGYQGRRQ